MAEHSLSRAAAESGFFQVTGHGIPQPDIDVAFDAAERLFALPSEVEERRTMPPRTNSGWEFKTQKRPSTGTYDHKETYQVTISRMERLDLWPTEEEIAWVPRHPRIVRSRQPGARHADDARYSIAYFAQADRDALIESPSGKHAPITAADYLQQRIAANFAS